jgi:GMP synthase-like glutamine amidotransferase
VSRQLNILVFQHATAESPGVFCDYFREDGVTLCTIEFDRGQTVPNIASFDFLMVMGGPQDVWQESEYPWLTDEKAAIRKFVIEMRRPFLGICLGHQLLAEAIGGIVTPAKTPEIGVFASSKTNAGHRDAIIGGLPDPHKALQWRSAEVAALPDGTTVLASSEACSVQAFRYGARVQTTRTCGGDARYGSYLV